MTTVRRKAAITAAVLLGLGVAGYVVMVTIGQRTVSMAGNAMRDAVSKSRVHTVSLPPGSVVRLGDDTIAVLRAVSVLIDTTGVDSTLLFAGQIHTSAEARLGAGDFVAVRTRPGSDSAEVFELVGHPPAGVKRIGQLVLRAAKDSSAARTYPVY
ncbi:MAG TPA: hypothetical protein VEA99_00760 [Gemmatimonadaceae bacterium]|nr:hypothetical protein [Gemmatimonadaceae bacterium]